MLHKFFRRLGDHYRKLLREFDEEIRATGPDPIDSEEDEDLPDELRRPFDCGGDHVIR